VTAPTVIEAGPATIRRLRCGTADVGAPDAESAAAALDGIDEPVALVDEQPVDVDALWCSVLRPLCDAGPVVIVYPSWWAPARVVRVRAAARTVAGDVVTCSRAWLLATAAAGPSTVVEIGPALVALTGTGIVAQPRNDDPESVAAAVTARIAAATDAATVLIDAPSGVDGAGALASMIAERLGKPVQVIDDAALERLAAAAIRADKPQTAAGVAPARRHLRRWLVAAGLALTVALAGMRGCGPHRAPVLGAPPMTDLVEGRITLQVPAQWPAQRVTAGPGSARVVLTSPADSQVALHVTQSLVPDETLSATAESLADALAEQPAGVFVDFTPAADRAGRPAVTYREVRAGHDIRWTIVLDGAVRISIGCQSPPDDKTAVREVCEQAVRSAHTLG
jgi:type VII secretion-associated protein (TIGR03931 family)